jgi:acetyl-CoA carboxylase alpha subunit
MLKESLADALSDLTGLPGEELVRRRREKFRTMGVFA